MIFDDANPQGRSDAVVPAGRQSRLQLSARTARSHSEVLSVLYDTLGRANVNVRTEAGTLGCLEVAMRLPITLSAGLYLRMVSCGLEFDRWSQQQLALLCAVSWHVLEDRFLEVWLRLLFREGLCRVPSPGDRIGRI